MSTEIMAIIKNNLDISEPINIEAELRYLGLDSLDLVYLIIEIESLLGREVQASEVTMESTINDLFKLVK